MIALSHKTKQYLLVTLKVLILGITFWYIYSKLTHENSLPLDTFITSLQHKSLWPLFLFLSLAVANWSFEILKWKTVIAPVKRISFKEAAQQSLAALTASLVTPNRIGDYGAKAYFFPSEKRKQVLLLNFLGNVAQMACTIFFGVIGLSIVIVSYSLSFSVLKIAGFILALIFLVIIGYLFKEKELLIKGLSVKNIMSYVKGLPAVLKRKVFVYSAIRYLCFSYLFLKFLRFFEADIALSQAYPLVFTMYLLVSVIPTVFIFDVVVRGGVAVWLFSLAGIPELTVLCSVLGMWLLNFVFPSVLGSFYMMTYKPIRS